MPNISNWMSMITLWISISMAVWVSATAMKKISNH